MDNTPTRSLKHGYSNSFSPWSLSSISSANSHFSNDSLHVSALVETTKKTNPLYYEIREQFLNYFNSDLDIKNINENTIFYILRIKVKKVTYQNEYQSKKKEKVNNFISNVSVCPYKIFELYKNKRGKCKMIRNNMEKIIRSEKNDYFKKINVENMNNIFKNSEMKYNFLDDETEYDYIYYIIINCLPGNRN